MPTKENTPPPRAAARIVIIGTGKVAEAFALRCVACGYVVVQVIGRNAERAAAIANAVNAAHTTDFFATIADADLYLVAVSDDAIQRVVMQLVPAIPYAALVVHTSGAQPATAVASFFPNGGVIYPLQSFAAVNGNVRPVNWEALPLCVSAPPHGAMARIAAFAATLSPIVQTLTDEQRAALHVAAVLVNNFTNHLYTMAQNILTPELLSFDLLLPLITETASRLYAAPPDALQTGPAVRGDTDTIARHLALLARSPATAHYGEVYEWFTKDIGKRRAEEAE